MRTTITLDMELVRDLLRFTKSKTKTAAVAEAVKEQIRRAKLKELAGLLGTLDIDENSADEGDLADLERSQWLDGIGALEK